jgi:uncharacterized protein (TIGR04255 family)
MRAMDVNLLYAHHIRIAWERFSVNIGDRALGVGCLGPYPGWTLFKKAIIEISNLVDETKLLGQIERMALKYTNIIPNSIGTAAAIANFDLRLGTKDASSALFHIRAEITDGDALHITQLASNGAVVLVDGSVREGTVIDIDTVRNNSPEVEPSIFFKRLPEQVEELHLKTKTMFFSLLKADTVTKLGATYG